MDDEVFVTRLKQPRSQGLSTLPPLVPGCGWSRDKL